MGWKGSSKLVIRNPHTLILEYRHNVMEISRQTFPDKCLRNHIALFINATLDVQYLQSAQTW
jgi:hypothetical protein